MIGLTELWRRRRNADAKETFPYWKYVFSSGFGLVAAAAVFLSIQGYIFLLREAEQTGGLPVSLPFAAASLLTVTLLWNPVRTYLTEPDIVFLTPAESRMTHYFRPAWNRGLLQSGFGVCAALLAIWPFFSALGGTALVYGAVIIMTVVIKAILFFGSREEKRFDSPTYRIVFLAVKALAAFASIHLMFRFPLSVSIPAVVVVWAAYLLSLRLPGKFSVHWEYLIREERRKKAVTERWFSQFVDLPRSEETYRRRAYLQPLLTLASKNARNAYVYLYWRTLLRSSIFMILVRLMLLEYLFMFLFPGKWTSTAIYAGFVILAGIQLKSLETIRRDVLHLAVSPIPEEQRRLAVRTIRRSAHRAWNVLAALPLFAVMPWHFVITLTAAGVVAPVLFARGKTGLTGRKGI
ncbi:ABC transporter permease [Paenibacillus alkalitolerans]|uniref:ABC transporter permease n=1 Tax=Paenibacillus alkalitolerans TaxID=2799335 RepID=UPI0018F58424|nr:ABC transporter permease [Paenibacillus alkalitolerans]